MSTRAFYMMAALLGSLVVAGCSSDPQPTQNDIQQSVAFQLPSFASITSFSVEAMQNIGTKVEPVWHTRFHGAITVNSPTFKEDGAESDVIFLRPARKAGESIDIFGKSASTLYQGSWRTSSQMEGQLELGTPEDAFAPRTVIIRGSKAERAYLAKKEAEEQRWQRLISQATTPNRELGRCRTKTGDQAGELFVTDVGFRATTPWPSIKPDVVFASVTSITKDSWGGMPTVVFQLTESIPNSAAPGVNWTAFFFDSAEQDKCYGIAVQAYSAWNERFPELVHVGQRGLQSRLTKRFDRDASASTLHLPATRPSRRDNRFGLVFARWVGV